MPLPQKIRSVKPAKPTPYTNEQPLWKGPEEDGITFSLLNRYLTCKERFRVYTLLGLRGAPRFEAPSEFGNMWHVCEEALANPVPENPGEHVPEGGFWATRLAVYCKDLARKYPMDQQHVYHWQNVCRVMFPLYVDHWKHHPDVVDRTPVFQEQVFDVKYPLPSGRVVRLRGKWDAVDLIGRGKQAAIYLQENKTKGQIDVPKLTRQLTFDLQTGLYLVALKHGRCGYGEHGTLVFGGTASVKGVRYNVVRRPSHHAGKKESTDEFADRLRAIITAAPGEFFARWCATVTPDELDVFRAECLDPLLDNLCNWYHHVTGRPMTQNAHDNLLFGRHWRHPFGVRNVLDEGGATDLDEYLRSGSTAGLVRVGSLFRELEDGNEQAQV
jgi:hypothetical protein